MIISNVRSRDWWLAFFIIPLALLIAFGSLALDRVDLEPSHLLLLLLLLLLSLAPFLLAFMNQRFDIFHPVFVIAWTFIVNFVVATFLLLWRNYRLSSGIDYRPELNITLVAAIIALGASYIGYFAGRRLFANITLADGIRKDTSERSASRILFRIAALALVVTTIFFLLWLYFAQIPIAYLNALDTEFSYTLAMQEAETSIIYLWMFRLSWPLLTLLAWSSAPSVPAKLFAGAAWLATLFVYVVSANRGSLFFFLAATAIFHYIRQKRRPSLLFVVTALGLLTVASGYLVIARGNQAAVDRTAIFDEAAQELTIRGPLTGVMEVTYVFPDRLPYLGFSAISDIIYAPIPRVLWPGKPLLRPVQNIMTGLLPTQDSHAPSVIGIYYAGFGLAGVFAILFIYGVVSRAIYNLWRGNPDSPLAQLLLAGWYSYIWNLIIRGALSQTVISITYIFGPLIAAWFVAQLIARPARRRTQATYE